MANPVVETYNDEKKKTWVFNQYILAFVLLILAVDQWVWLTRKRAVCACVQQLWHLTAVNSSHRAHLIHQFALFKDFLCNVSWDFATEKNKKKLTIKLLNFCSVSTWWMTTIINKPLHCTLFHLLQTCAGSFKSRFRFFSCKPADESSAIQNSFESSKKRLLTSFELVLKVMLFSTEPCQNKPTLCVSMLACSNSTNVPAYVWTCVCIHINTHTPMCPCSHTFMCRFVTVAGNQNSWRPIHTLNEHVNPRQNEPGQDSITGNLTGLEPFSAFTLSNQRTTWYKIYFLAKKKGSGGGQPWRRWLSWSPKKIKMIGRWFEK